MTQSRAFDTFVDNLPAGIRPQPFTATTWTAFRVSEPGRTYPSKTYPLAIGEQSSLTNAKNAGAIHCRHKDRLVIRETDDSGSRLHVYAIRKKAPQWVHQPGEFMPRRVEDLIADPVCVIDEGALG